jgi:hypothetical protein
MLLWLKRWVAYLLLSSGLALLFAPLSTHRAEDIEKDFLYLEISETLAAAKSKKDEPSPAKPDSGKNAWEQMIEKQEQQALEDARAAATTNAYGYPRLQPDDLAPYPELRKELDGMQRTIGHSPYDHMAPSRKDAVPAEEWLAFRQAAGISGEDNAFQYGKYIFKGRVKPETVSVPVEIKHLKTGCKAAAGLFLVLGLWALYGTYLSPSGGIRVGRRSAIIIWDVIIVVVGGVFTWWFLEFVLAKIFQTATEWGEPFAVGMGVFWVAFVYPVLALITTALALQTILITRETVTLKGLFGADTVKWSEVEGMRVSQAFSPRKVGSVPAPHRVMKILIISAGKSTLRVMEPPYASTKKKIIAALMENAPEKVKPSITSVSKEWLAYL